jgi:hypothetical protein
MSRENSPLRDRVLFVVGARRSGTNWIERILAAHPDVVAIPTETYLFSDGIKPLTERFQHANPSTAAMGRTYMPRERLMDLLRDFTDAVFLEALERRRPEARYIVERTPWHASHLPLIAAVYPDARVLHIVRDARAIARSLVAMQWGPTTIEQAAEEWRTTVEDAHRGAESLAPGRYHEVLYEDLVANPRARTEQIFSWLDLELNDEMWARILEEAGAAFNVDPSSPGVRPDKWRDELSEADLQTIERVAGDQLDRLGYERGGATAAPAGRLEAVRAAAGKVRRPRGARRAYENRVVRRRRNAARIAHKRAVADFERLVAGGDESGARALLADRLWFKRDDDGARGESRGEGAVEELLTALGEHRERGMRVLAGHVHESAYAVTTVVTYELDGGERWSRTLVYHAAGGRITEVGLYRYRLAGQAS